VVEKKTGRVTIVDIAKAANLSPATVSLALNNKGNMPEERRRLIKQLARELNYMPSAVARALRGGSTRTIGVVINYFNNPFFRQFFIGLEEVADKLGFTFSVTQSHDILEKEQKQVRQLAQQGADGIIILACSLSTDHLDEIRTTWNIPVVPISNSLGESFPLITVDNKHGGALVAEHFLTLAGRKNIHLAGPFTKEPMCLRWQGFRDTLRDKDPGFDQDNALFSIEELRAEAGFNIMPVILEKVSVPFNIFVVNDEVALGVLHYCRKNGLRVPDDIAVAGFSNVDILESYGIPLTSVESDAENMGREAMNTLSKLIKSGENNASPIINPVYLVVRGSTVFSPE